MNNHQTETAEFSTHVLDGTTGTHAAGVLVTVAVILPSGERRVLFRGETASDGRITAELDTPSPGPPGSPMVCEAVFEIGAYFSGRGNIRTAEVQERTGVQMTELVFRVRIPRKGGRFHLPVIMSPHANSAWWSG